MKDLTLDQKVQMTQNKLPNYLMPTTPIRTNYPTEKTRSALETKGTTT
jgi:hypothetical protein